jgi:hypothetical protein
MSKAVKSVGRAIGKVVKGVVNVVKKVAKSPIGKVLLAAATVYFGGAAIMGAMGGASASTGVMGTIGGALKGATAGIANAWTGLTGAASAAVGGNFGAAGSSLGSGFTGAYGAGSGAVSAANLAAAGGALPASPGAYGSVGTSGQTAAGTTLTSAPTAPLTTPPVTPPAEPGIISRAWNGLGDYGKMAAVQGATQLVGGAIQGVGQQKAMEEQRNFELQQQAEARDRYNRNVGTRLWGDAPTDNSQYARVSVFDQQDARIRQQLPMYMRGPSGGLIGGNMGNYPGYGYYPTYG